jgi:hypothetical protein
VGVPAPYALREEADVSVSDMDCSSCDVRIGADKLEFDLSDGFNGACMLLYPHSAYTFLFFFINLNAEMLHNERLYYNCFWVISFIKSPKKGAAFEMN